MVNKKLESAVRTLEKYGHRVLSVLDETMNTDAEITLENGVSISITQDGEYFVCKETAEHKFRTYDPVPSIFAAMNIINI